MLHSFSVPVLALKAFPRMGLSGFDLLPWLSWFSGQISLWLSNAIYSISVTLLDSEGPY